MSTAAPLQNTAAQVTAREQIVSRGIAVAAQVRLRWVGVIVIKW